MSGLLSGYLRWIPNNRQEAWASLSTLTGQVSWEFASLGINKVTKYLRGFSLGKEVGQQQNEHEQTRVSKKSRIASSPNRELVGSGQVLGQPANATALASLLRHYCKGKALNEGRCLHIHIMQCGYDCNTFLGNCLIQMYGNCGSMEEARASFNRMSNLNLHSWNILMNAYGQNGNLEAARSVFSRMPHRDLVSWNAMIAALAQNGHGKEALHLFRKMQLEKVKPNEITFVCALDSCATLAALEEGHQIHAIIVDSMYGQDVVVGNALLNMYGKCGSVQNARRVFGEISHRDVVSWTTMIAVFVQNGQGSQALDLFHQMQIEGIEPNNVTCVSALDACASVASLREGRNIHATIIDSSYGQSVAVENALINMYGKCGSVNDAEGVFARICPHDVVSWNAMIAAFIQNDLGKEALDLFHQMHHQVVKPDNVTYLCAVHACTCLAVLEEGQKIHAAIVHNGFGQNLLVETALINMYGKCGSVCDAEKMFGRIPHQDIICWNAMMATCAQNEQGEKALNLFHQMQFQGVKPDYITLVCALDACADLADLEEGQGIHAAIVESEYGHNICVGTALTNMYGRCGSVHNAEYVFWTLPHCDIVAWTAMMAAFTQNGHVKEALGLFSQMQLECVKPDDSTFICILTACSYTGLVEEGMHFFVSISRDYCLRQTVEHYVCAVDLLGRAGCLCEAEDLINRMPFHSAPLAWRCLLGACRIHGDVERGLRVAKHCFILDPDNATIYVTLCNLHSLGGRPLDAINTRDAMKMGGHSSIEVGKGCNVGDMPHLQGCTSSTAWAECTDDSSRMCT